MTVPSILTNSPVEYLLKVQYFIYIYIFNFKFIKMCNILFLVYSMCSFKSYQGFKKLAISKFY